MISVPTMADGAGASDCGSTVSADTDWGCGRDGEPPCAIGKVTATACGICAQIANAQTQLLASLLSIITPGPHNESPDSSKDNPSSKDKSKQPNPKDKKPCMIGPANSAKQVGVDAVQYTDSSGNTVTMSGGSRSSATNNPLNILYTPFSQSQGAIGSYNGAGQTTAIFPTYSAGVTAASTLWNSSTYTSQPTMLGAINIWAWGPNGTANYFNASAPYVQTTLSELPGITPSSPPSAVLPAQTSQLVQGQALAEGWKSGTETCGP